MTVSTGPDPHDLGEGDTSPQGLDALERLTAAQQAALARVPEDQPVPPEVLALLCAPAPEVEDHLVPLDMARLAGIQSVISAMIERLGHRQAIVDQRLRAVRRARQGFASAHRWDSRS